MREAGAGLSSWQLRKIDEVLWHSDGAPPGLSALADLCGLSTRHLMRAFKTATGRTVHAHFEEIRIIGAKMALARRVPLKQVAQDLGFAGPSSFIVAFRRATGETPGRDRQRPSAVMPSP